MICEQDRHKYQQLQKLSGKFGRPKGPNYSLWTPHCRSAISRGQFSEASKPYSPCMGSA